MKKQIVLLIVLFISLFSGYGQDIDSIVQVIKSQKDSTQINSLIALGRKLRRIDVDSSKATFQLAFERAKKIGFYKGQIRALRSRGITYGMNHKYVEAIADFNDAAILGKKYNMSELTADAYNGLGIVYKRIGDYVTSLKYYNKALSIYKKYGLVEGASSAYENMGVLYDLMGELENSYSYYLSAFKINDSLQHRDNNYALSLNIALYHIKKKQFKKAISILHKNVIYFDSIKSKYNLKLTYNNLGYAYKLMKEQDSTIFYTTKLIDLVNATTSINKYDATEAFLNRSNAYLEMGQFDKALRDAKTNFELAKDLGFTAQLESYKLKAIINETLGNYKESSLANKMVIALKDSLFEENKVKQYKAEQIKQQVFNKNEQIANQKNNIQLLNIDVKRKRDWNLILVIFISLLLISSLIVYNKITLKRKTSLQEAKRLKELDDLKSRFITNITHEFRTPLTIILGYLDNLKEQFTGKKETTTSLNIIKKNSNNLLSLVNQMLDLAKLEQGRLSLNLIQNDIVEFIQIIINSFSSIASDKNIRLSFKSEIEKLQMDFDAEKLRQVFSNLISNAIKFSEENTEITIKIEFENSNTKRLKVIISDQGLGIPKHDLPQVFDRFYQVDNQNFKVSQGTGIGLALTKELVELMSGSITVNSVLSQGTTFTIVLPIEQNAMVQEIKLQQQNISIGNISVPELEPLTSIKDSNTVLIVEDNKDMSRYIESCLQSQFKIIKAVNGKQGLEMALEQIPDLILTDVMMPIMDGYELTQQLQESDLTNHIPIVMLTSKAMQEDKIEGLTHGADAYLTKPFSKEELVLRIDKLIEKRKRLQENYQVKTVVKKLSSKKAINNKTEAFLNKALESVYKHLDDSEFSASKLAEELAMSDSQLYRKLKAISNTSTALFIRKVRLQKAKELLETTDLIVSEVAYATGFNDPNWFSKAFKDEFKLNPSELRK